MNTTYTNTSPSNPERSSLGHPDMQREHGLVFGMTYDSAYIVPDGTTPVQVLNPLTDYAPSARPGSRAPHIWLERNAERLSTLDLFGQGFVLLAGAYGQGWCDAAMAISDSHGIPIQAYRVGPAEDLADPGQLWVKTYGVGQDGAVLVRPDGYVAWRRATLNVDSAEEIGMALNTSLGGLSIPQPMPVRTNKS